MSYYITTLMSYSTTLRHCFFNGTYTIFPVFFFFLFFYFIFLAGVHMVGVYEDRDSTYLEKKAVK